MKTEIQIALEGMNLLIAFIVEAERSEERVFLLKVFFYLADVAQEQV